MDDVGIRLTRSWQVDDRDSADLRLVESPLDAPGPGQVLVRVEAVALNHRDHVAIHEGRGVPGYPFVPTSDLAGTVVEVGPGATSWSPGDRVISTFTPEWVDGLRPGTGAEPAYRTLGGALPGVLAEHLVLPGAWLNPAPRTLDAVAASTVPCAGVTAWAALVEHGRVDASQTVLVEGTGGVALFGLQIAKAHGARVVVSTSPGNMDRVASLGADVVVDRTTDDLVRSVHHATSGRGVDQVLELVGGSHLGQAAEAVAVGGHIHLIGALDGFEITSPLMPLLLKDVTLHGVATGSRAMTRRLVRAVDQVGLEPVVDSVHGFEDVPAAFTRLEDGPFGKVVVRVG